MAWPWDKQTNVDKDAINIVVEDNKRLQKKVKELEDKISDLEMDKEFSNNEKKLIEWIKRWMSKTNDETKEYLESDTFKHQREIKRLKGQINTLKARLDTFVAGLPQQHVFKQIDGFKAIINKFLENEQELFDESVREPLEDADFFEKFTVPDSIRKQSEEQMISIFRSLQQHISLLPNHLGDELSRVVYTITNILGKDVVLSSKNYEMYVKRSVGMNNKTKTMLYNLLDSIDMLEGHFTDEIVKLKLENQQLKSSILLDGDSAKRINELEREIQNLKMENEVLRYKKGE